MSTKYPIILAHGIAAKQLRVMNAFGRIGNELEAEGYKVYIADTDGFGSIENNAKQLKRFIEAVKITCECDKVNIIAHSKGGLDAKYMITHLGMEDSVASLTTLCTPHNGSIIASKLWDLPRPIKRFVAFFLDGFYRIVCHDEHPDCLKACEQLRQADTSMETLNFSYKVYCQSYSTVMDKAKDCFIMALPMKIHHHYENYTNDGMVSEDSTKFGNYRGRCLDIPISHSQIVDFFAKKSQKEQIYTFYKRLASELEEMEF